MSDSVLTLSENARRGRLRALLPAAAVTAAIVTLVHATRAGDAGIVNSDNLMRMVAVRDLLAGQNWYDLTQYRMGGEDGVAMHWSRLVDAPLAAIVVAGDLLGGQGFGERLAAWAWPAITLLLTLLAMGWGALRAGGEAVLKPAMIVGGVALFAAGVYAPGSFDHHNIQIALAMALVAAVLPRSGPDADEDDLVAMAVAALACAAMLAIGMETLPYVAMGGLVVAMRFVTGSLGRLEARQFGLVLMASVTVLFVGLVPMRAWFDAACDGFSMFHLVMATAGGAGLAMATAPVFRTAPQRAGALALVGAACAALLTGLFPACLADPLAGLDPRLQAFWLNGIVEARSAADLARQDPWMLLALFGMPLVAFAVCIHAIVAGRRRTAHLVLAAFVLAGIAVTAWQQRGSMFAAAFATVPLALWINYLSPRGEKTAASARLAVLAAWVLSLNMTWGLSAAIGAKLLAGTPTLTQQAATASRDRYCFSPALFQRLAQKPAGTVMGASDLGASILYHTPHRSVAGPYHRNVSGNLALISAMTGSPERARAILAALDVSIVADCIGAPDSADFIAAAPQGFLSMLRDPYNRPTWIEPIADTVDSPMVLYRVEK